MTTLRCQECKETFSVTDARLKADYCVCPGCGTSHIPSFFVRPYHNNDAVDETLGFLDELNCRFNGTLIGNRSKALYEKLRLLTMP